MDATNRLHIHPVSAAAGGRRRRELAADLACQPEVDLPVARDDGSRSCGACPAGVVGALVDAPATLLDEVSLQVAELHAAMVRWISSRSRVSSSSAVGSGESISRKASSTFARASSRVRPWLKTPGTSGI